jgi:orotidine-5'-phosphate decarboxylase
MPAGDAATLLSTKPIPARERLIVPLDVPDREAALALVRQLGDAVSFYKLGLELFVSGAYFELARELADLGKKLFFDLKLFDIPETVAGAVRQLRSSPASFVTVHGNQGILAAACREKGDLKVLGVTVLTSLDRSDLVDLGFPAELDVADLVLSRARRALAAGCDGVISSGLEARRLREELGARFLIVTPGIRPVDNAAVEDQKRVMTPRDAFLAGADYVVVGRPVRSAPDPRKAALAIQETIAELFPL